MKLPQPVETALIVIACILFIAFFFGLIWVSELIWPESPAQIRADDFQ